MIEDGGDFQTSHDLMHALVTIRCITILISLSSHGEISPDSSSFGSRVVFSHARHVKGRASASCHVYPDLSVLEQWLIKTVQRRCGRIVACKTLSSVRAPP